MVERISGVVFFGVADKVIERMMKLELLVCLSKNAIALIRQMKVQDVKKPLRTLKIIPPKVNHFHLGYLWLTLAIGSLPKSLKTMNDYSDFPVFSLQTFVLEILYFQTFFISK